MSQTDRHLTILVVDDDPLILMGTVDMLEDLGHLVMPAKSGLQALEILKEARVDLVLTDQSMPQMTGAELAIMIRARHPDLPIVLVTGYAALPANLPAGVRRLGKPFSQSDLIRVVADVKTPAA